jgi:release factor glutamine methyltransferase
MASTLQTIRENIKKELAGHYPDREIESLSEILFSHRLDIRGHEIGLRRNEILKPGDAAWFSEAIDRLKKAIPVQHITGETEFFGLKLKVGPEALIPRPETEELVQWILEDIGAGKPPQNPGGVSILDIGTGTGCIALSLASRLPEATIFATDIHSPALDLARENTRRLGLNVKFLLHDILRAGETAASSGTGRGDEWKAAGFPELDLIVSNPPYIPVGERDSLDANVRESDPPSALFVPDADPLLFHRHIAGFGRRNLRSGGLLYLEIHERSGPLILQVLEQAGFREIVLRKDINGKDRMVRARQTANGPFRQQTANGPGSP